MIVAMSDRSRKLLLVEDDPAVATVYRLGLEKDGYRVLVAPDGEAGVERARTESPYLVLLDIALPKLDGFQVLERLRSDPATSGIPVAIVSNSMLVADPRIDRARTLGILDWLVKSTVAPGDLSRRVSEWLG